MQKFFELFFMFTLSSFKLSFKKNFLKTEIANINDLKKYDAKF